MRKVLAFILALTMTLSLAIPAFAANDLPRYFTENGVDYVECNVGFHCGGRVRPDGWNKDLVVVLERVDATTWKLTDDFLFECPKCGRTDWVSFSNSNGVFNGKNIQLVHGNITEPPKTSAVYVYPSAVLKTTTETTYEIYQKYFTPYRKDIQWVSESYDSVTATYANYEARIERNVKNGKITEKIGKIIVPNSNHFTYAAFTPAQLAAGVDLALVVGNKIDYVGDAKLFINNDGKLELSFGDDEFYYAKWGFVAFNDSFAIPKNGNIHSDKLFGGHESNYVYNNPGAGKDGMIYIYVHFDSLQYKLDLEKGVERWVEKYEEKVGERTETTGPVFEDLDVLFTVYDCDDLTLDCEVEGCGKFDITELDEMPPGTYKIVFTVLNPDGSVREVYAELFDVIEGVDTEIYFDREYDDLLVVDGGKEYQKPNIWNPLVIVTQVKVKK